jgi:hypothetical protein
MPLQSPSWRRVPTDTTQSFGAIGISDAGVFLLGEGEIHLRRPDGSWAAPIALGERWTDMSVVGPQLIFGLTEGDAVVRQWRSGNITTVGKVGSCASQDSRMSAYGETLVAGCPYYRGLAFWLRGPEFGFTEAGAFAPRALMLIAENDVVFLDSGGIKRLRGGATRAVSLATPPSGHELLWATRNNLITASPAGQFAHWGWDPATNEAGPMATMRAPSDVRLQALWGLNADDVYAVGRDGVVLNFDGRSWRRIPVPSTASLRCMAGAFRELWIAGSDGVLLRCSA